MVTRYPAKEPRQLLGGKKSPFSKCSIKWIPLWEKVDICPHVTWYRIIKTWSIDLNIQLNILRVLEEKRRENICNLGSRQRFLRNKKAFYRRKR